MEINFILDYPICLTECPFGKRSKVASQCCKECEYFVRLKTPHSIICNHPDSTIEQMESEIKWRKAKAGHNFGKDTVVLYNGDPDARLVRCAVNDCIYIHVEDLLKLPKE